MTTPIVTELPRTFEPITTDPFIAADTAAPRVRTPWIGTPRRAGSRLSDHPPPPDRPAAVAIP
jgi:hypothetical protein